MIRPIGLASGLRSRSALLFLCALAMGCAKSVDGVVADEEDLATAEDLAAPTEDLRPPVDLRAAIDLALGPDMAPVTGCQVSPQSGCLANQKCTTHDYATTICDPVGPDGRGQNCTVAGEIDSCAAGSMCIDEVGPKDQCRAFCKADADCGTSAYCMYNLIGTGGFRLCSQPCNAIYPGTIGCAAGLGCVALNLERTDCLGPGPSGEAQPCAVGGDCKGGMACIGPAGAGLCRRVCKKGDSGACAAGSTCLNVFSVGFGEWPRYGVCCPGGAC